MMNETTRRERHRRFPLRSGAVLVLATILLALVTTDAFAITRASVLARAQTWIDIKVPYSQLRSGYFRGYRADCSGFTSMSWKTGTSWATDSLWRVDTKIKVANLKPGDAMIRPKKSGSWGHATIFVGWLDATHTKYVVYEQTSSTQGGNGTQCNIKDVASVLSQGYRAYRYDKISTGAPQWNLAANPTFDVWARSVPVWWEFPNTQWGSIVCSRAVDVTKTGNSALRLLNDSGKSSDVVEMRQTQAVKSGVPYRLSLWANASADPRGLETRITFVNAAGATLKTTSLSGATSHVGTSTLTAMSITATAPANTTSATISVRLAGGVDANGSAGTAAVVDDVRFFDASPVSSTCTLSAATLARSATATIDGTVSAPVSYGTVRVYVTRPGSTNAVALAERKLVAGAWSMQLKPGLKGTYRFTAKYLGWGPYATVDSGSVSLLVK